MIFIYVPSKGDGFAHNQSAVSHVLDFSGSEERKKAHDKIMQQAAQSDADDATRSRVRLYMVD